MTPDKKMKQGKLLAGLAEAGPGVLTGQPSSSIDFARGFTGNSIAPDAKLKPSSGGGVKPGLLVRGLAAGGPGVLTGDTASLARMGGAFPNSLTAPAAPTAAPLTRQTVDRWTAPPTAATPAVRPAPAGAPVAPTPQTPRPVIAAPARSDGVTKTIGADGNPVYTGAPEQVNPAAAGPVTGAPQQLARLLPPSGQASPSTYAVPAIATSAGGGFGSNFQREEATRRIAHVQPLFEGQSRGERATRAAAANALAAPYMAQIAAMDQSQLQTQKTAGDLAQIGATGQVAGAKQEQQARIDSNAAQTEQQGAQRLLQMRAESDANAPTQVVDAEGNYVQVRGATATPITGADGKTLRAPKPRASAEGAITPEVALKSLTDQLGTMDQFTDPDGTQRANLQQRIQVLMQADRQIVRTGTKNGKKVVQYSDGTIEEQP